MDDKLGNRIKRLRLQAELTQSELAQMLNVSSALISAYELGVRKPSLELLADLANIFGVTTDYLLGMKHSSLYSTDGLSFADDQAIRTIIDSLRIKQNKGQAEKG